MLYTASQIMGTAQALRDLFTQASQDEFSPDLAQYRNRYNLAPPQAANIQIVCNRLHAARTIIAKVEERYHFKPGQDGVVNTRNPSLWRLLRGEGQGYIRSDKYCLGLISNASALDKTLGAVILSSETVEGCADIDPILRENQWHLAHKRRGVDPSLRELTYQVYTNTIAGSYTPEEKLDFALKGVSWVEQVRQHETMHLNCKFLQRKASHVETDPILFEAIADLAVSHLPYKESSDRIAYEQEKLIQSIEETKQRKQRLQKLNSPEIVIAVQNYQQEMKQHFIDRSKTLKEQLDQIQKKGFEARTVAFLLASTDEADTLDVLETMLQFLGEK